MSEDLTAELLRNYVDPEVIDFLDLDRLKCEATGDVGETLSEYVGDLRFSTNFKHSERRSEVFIFLEHQSKKDHLIGFRLLRYIVNAYEKLLEERDGGGRAVAFPYPVAVVLYHGKSRWKDMPRMPDLIQKVPGIDPEVLKFPLFLVDLAAMPEKAIQGGPALRALLTALQAAGTGKLAERVDSITEELAKTKGDRRTSGWMTALVTYIAEQCEFKNVKDFYIRSFGKLFGRKEGENMGLTAADQLRQEGKVELIIDVLEERFNTVPAAIKKAIESKKDLRTLNSLAKSAATCKSLDEFKRRLKI